MTKQVVKEGVNPREIDPKKLTNNCYFVYRQDGNVDIARGPMVRIFDLYHDLGIQLNRIIHAKGTRNPKFQQPEV
jgi:hypothetical protein